MVTRETNDVIRAQGADRQGADRQGADRQRTRARIAGKRRRIRKEYLKNKDKEQTAPSTTKFITWKGERN
jgi:hypothetical protein